MAPASTTKTAAGKKSGTKPAATAKTKTGSGKAKTTKSAGTRKGKKSRRTASYKRGQQKIDPARAREIQEALIREKYLDGEPTGQWDPASQKAMEKFQGDNGWQTKTIPDSRALIKLGLGPDHQHLLNPESAMTTQPAAPRNVKETKPDSPGNHLPQ
jgi:hypothetical protein